MITEEQKEQCTGFNHRWDFVVPPPWARTVPRGYSDHYMVCDGCTSMRRVSVDKLTGEKRIRYYYVDGYHDWKGSRRDFAGVVGVALQQQGKGGGVVTNRISANVWFTVGDTGDLSRGEWADSIAEAIQESPMASSWGITNVSAHVDMIFEGVVE